MGKNIIPVSPSVAGEKQETTRHHTTLNQFCGVCILLVWTPHYRDDAQFHSVVFLAVQKPIKEEVAA